MEGFFRYEFRELTFGGAYTWRGLFTEILRYSSRVLVGCHVTW